MNRVLKKVEAYLTEGWMINFVTVISVIILEFLTRGPMAQQSKNPGHIATDMGLPAIPHQNQL